LRQQKSAKVSVAAVAAVCLLFGCAVQPSVSTPQGSSSGVPAVSTSDTPKFRDLTFGQGPTPDMVHVAGDSGLPCYSRPSDDLSTGSGSLSGLKYCFYNNQMADVVMHTQGEMNSDSLLAVLQAKYGPGDQPNEFMPEYFWHAGGLFNPPLTIVYDKNEITDDATAVTSYQPLMNAMSSVKNNAAAGASVNY
jgi:hypothetical protein